MSVATYLDLFTQAAQELNIVPRGIGMTDLSMQQFFLDRFTLMIDSWNLKPTVVPWYQQQILPLKAGQQSYLIGSGAPDWDAPRPIRLDPNATNVLLTSGSNAPQRMPVAVLSHEQWANIAVQSQSTSPQGIYLDRSVQTGPKPMTNMTVNNNAGWSIGVLSVNATVLAAGPPVMQVDGTYVTSTPYYASRIWVWGIPSTTNQIELFYWQALMVGNLTDPVNAAPGYFRAMMLNLAIEVASAFGITPTALTIRNAADALGDIKELNAPDMTMQADPGMPGTRGGYITRSQFISGTF